LPTATSVQARSFVGGPPPGDPFSGDNFYRIRLTWDVPTTVAEDRVIEYHVFRDGALIDVATPYNRYVTDGPGRYEVAYKSVQSPQSLEDRTVTRTPLPIQTPVRYKITYLAKIGKSYQESPLLETETVATAIWIPNFPNQQFSWEKRSENPFGFVFGAVFGADRYVAEFSATRDFNNIQTVGPVSFAATSENQTCYLFQKAMDLSTNFPNAKPGDRLYVRVGARNALDSPDASGNLVYSYSPVSEIVVSQASLLPPTP
jgi:hypothetical protein